MRKDKTMTGRRYAHAISRWLGRASPSAVGCGRRHDGHLTERDQFAHWTSHARNVLALAQEEAQRLQHSRLGTEHLLLGLVREGEGVAGHILRSLGVELDQVRQAVEARIGHGDQTVRGEMRLTPRAKRVLELAALEARRFQHDYLDTEHLLLGVLLEGEGIGAEVLTRFELSGQHVREKTLERLHEA